MLFWQILIDGFAISALYALGATGFTLIFGVTGVLNLSHGAIMVAAAVAAWAAAGTWGFGPYFGAFFGVGVGVLLSLATYFLIVQRLQRSRAIREEEKEIFILTATLLWGIMIQEAIAYLFTNNAKTVLPIVEGVVTIAGVRTPANEIFTACVCWLAIAALWLFVNRTRAGKAAATALASNSMLPATVRSTPRSAQKLRISSAKSALPSAFSVTSCTNASGKASTPSRAWINRLMSPVGSGSSRSAVPAGLSNQGGAYSGRRV